MPSLWLQICKFIFFPTEVILNLTFEHDIWLLPETKEYRYFYSNGFMTLNLYSASRPCFDELVYASSFSFSFNGLLYVISQRDVELKRIGCADKNILTYFFYLFLFIFKYFLYIVCCHFDFTPLFLSFSWWRWMTLLVPVLGPLARIPYFIHPLIWKWGNTKESRFCCVKSSEASLSGRKGETKMGYTVSSK